jgi:hypothetical protein
MKSAIFEAFRLSDFECATLDKAPAGSKISGSSIDLSAKLTENVSKPQLGRTRYDDIDQT